MKNRIATVCITLVLFVCLCFGASAFDFTEISQINWSEIDWKNIDWATVIEEKIIPGAAEMIMLIATVYLTFRSTVNKVKLATGKFEGATEEVLDANAIAKKAAEIAEQAQKDMTDFCREYADKMAELREQQEKEVVRMRLQMEEMANSTGKSMEIMKEMMVLGFGSVDELVQKNKARAIAKLTEDDNGKEIA